VNNNNLTNIFLDGILVQVKVCYWSGAKMLTASDLGLKEEELPEAFKLGKKYLVPPEVIRAFRAVESCARRRVEESSFVFPFGNAKFVPKRKFPSMLKDIKEDRDRYNRLVDDLIDKYGTYRERMIPIYREAAEHAWTLQKTDPATFGIEYNPEKEKAEFVQQFMSKIEAAYPPVDSLRQRFSLSWQVYEIAAPRMEEAGSDNLAQDLTERAIAEEEYRHQIHAQIGDFVSDVIRTLRSKTTDMCGRILENLKAGKVIRSQSLESLGNFITQFKEMNFVGDERIEAMLENLHKEVLTRYTPEDYKTEEAQEVLKRKIGEIVEAASDVTDISGITGEYKRKISWKEEEVAVNA